MSKWAASNIKRARASVDEEVTNQFFDNVATTLDGLGDIPPENIFNFDETNHSDDPGAKDVFVRRGRSRVENVEEHSKCSFSTMWCASPAGEVLSPMVVYRSKHLC